MEGYLFWGNCHQVARVLHKLTGKPIVILYGERDPNELDKPCDYDPDDEDAEDWVDEEIEYILIHCGVLINGRLVDEKGFNMSPDEELEEYESINDPYSRTEVMDDCDLDTLNEIARQCYCPEDDIEKEIEKYLLDQEWIKPYLK